jgi:hypothetical protein
MRLRCQKYKCGDGWVRKKRWHRFCVVVYLKGL